MQRSTHVLTEAQLGLWYAQRLAPDNPIYNTGQYVEIAGALDVGALAEAIRIALEQSPALRVRIADTDEGPVARDGDTPIDVERVDLSGDANAVAAAQQWMQRDMKTPRDLERDPLVREVIFTLAPDRFIWYQCIHHLVIDGYGTALFTRHVCDLYAELTTSAGTVGSLGSYDAVLTENEEYLSSTKRDKDRAFWLDAFADRPTVAGLATGIAATAYDYLRCSAPLDPDLTGRVHTLAASANVPWPDVIVTLVAAYVARHTCTREVILGVPYMARLGTAAARVPAMVMNVLPVRLDIDEDLPVADVVTAHGRALRTARRHGRYRSEQLRRDLELLGANRRLYGAIVNVLPFDETPRFGDTTAALHTLGTGPVDDLTITIRASATGQALSLELDANPRLYRAADAEAHACRLATFLNAAASASSLATVPTLTPSETTWAIDEVNRTAHAVPDVTLVELIEATMRRTAEAAALTDGDTTLTYAELDARSTSLARGLIDADVRRGDVVAVALPRSIELSVALIAVLRAGAAYLPIDTALPHDRVSAMLRSAQPRVAIAIDATRSVFGESLRILDPANVHAADATPLPTVSPADAAYVIYTSGSTGEPKGVVIEHRAIVNRLEWMRVFYGIGAGDRILQKTPFTFDVSVWELFLPYVAGGLLVMAPPEAHRDPVQLARLVREHRITTMHFVPSMLAAFLAEPDAQGIELARVFVSGEALSASLRDRFHTVVRAELHNLYGPTEAAVDVTYWNASRDDSSPVPIGFPVWNTSLYVLDDRMRPTPPDVPGDLYIGGVQLAREYLGRADFTRDRFVEHPFAEGARLYRTGDVATRRTDGALLFLGRSDHQIKIRGLRIELGDIESALMATGLVSNAVVIAVGDDSADRWLAAYVVPQSVTSADALRSALVTRLPDYMIPGAFILLDELPMTASGKVNRAALPSPSRVIPATRDELRSATERAVAESFVSILSIDRALGGDSDFFALGGHSLLAVRLVAAVRARLGEEVALGAIFAHPTVRRFAKHLDDLSANRSNEGLGPLILVAGSDADDRPPLFCVHPAGGISWCYGALGRALGDGRRVFGLQARALESHTQPPRSLDDMAAQYVASIRAIQPRGPYHLAGWSVGGIIAHTMAAQLAAAGERVSFVALLDAYPSDRWKNEADAPEGAALKALLLIAGFDPASFDRAALTRDDVVRFLRERSHPLGELSDAALHNVIRVVASNNALVRRHEHTRFDGTVLHFRAALDHAGKDLSPSEWQPYSSQLETFDIASLHAHMTAADASRAIAGVLAPRFMDSFRAFS